MPDAAVRLTPGTGQTRSRALTEGFPMDVFDTARELGLLVENESEPIGGISEKVVLDALEKLAAKHRDSSELFPQAGMGVKLSRPAGLERGAADSVFARHGKARAEQFRYRAEMGEVFIDLAID